MILSCQNLSKTFVDRPILKQASFQLEEHEKAAIVGVNGAGKTTLLKMIIGQLPADEGLITFAKDKTFGYLAQQSDLSSSHTIYEELLSVKQDLVSMEQQLRDLEESMKHCEGTQLEEIMNRYTRMTHDFEVRGGLLYKSELTGVLKGLSFLDEDFDKQISTLSGGQKTRVSLAKLLLQSPDLIILDEPTNGLDPAGIVEIRQIIREYNRQFGVSVMVSSHLLSEVEQICDHLILIDGGRLKAWGEIGELLDSRPRLRLRTDRPESAAALLRRAVAGNVLPPCGIENGPDGILLELGESCAGAVNRLLVENGFNITHLAVERQTLENFFLKETAGDNGHA